MLQKPKQKMLKLYNTRWYKVLMKYHEQLLLVDKYKVTYLLDLEHTYTISDDPKGLIWFATYTDNEFVTMPGNDEAKVPYLNISR